MQRPKTDFQFNRLLRATDDPTLKQKGFSMHGNAVKKSLTELSDVRPSPCNLTQLASACLDQA